jgi:hypothetical protein
VGPAEAQDRDDRDDQEDEDRDGRGEAVLRPRATEGEPVGVGDEDVGVAGLGIVRRERGALADQVDGVEVVEVEGERRDQQRSQRDQQ